jgi:dTDP-4-amino-4,6-dideoxygalactose transaminase
MNNVAQFETIIKDFYGARYAVAVDCCTHAIELCLRMLNPKVVTCPKHTYLSVPMTFEKLNIPWHWMGSTWSNYYYIGNTNIIDAAVHWEEGGYLPGTLMCLSFQFRKHLNLGRGGMILLDDYDQYQTLKKMRYDGRLDDIPWAAQSIDTFGYHYYMTPETATMGLERFAEARSREPRKWSHLDYPDLSTMPVFQPKENIIYAI